MEKSKKFKNVFDALIDDSVVAKNLEIRSDLMILLEKEIRGRGLTQSEAASLFDVSQPRISDLIKGNINKFSIDVLINMLAAMGKEVSIKASNRKVSTQNENVVAA